MTTAINLTFEEKAVHIKLLENLVQICNSTIFLLNCVDEGGVPAELESQLETLEHVEEDQVLALLAQVFAKEMLIELKLKYGMGIVDHYGLSFNKLVLALILYLSPKILSSEKIAMIQAH